jgi:uncharacterized protein YjbI with pentapeptide repeats
MSDADPIRRRANDNPWYWLATVHGEQTATAGGGDWDEQLAADNRGAWNGWMARDLSNEQRAILVKELHSLFARRPIDGAPPIVQGDEFPPDPTGVPDFSGTNFDHPVTFRGFLFPRMADFRSANFLLGRADFRSASFSDCAEFRLAQFRWRADFTSATFSGRADFDAAQFPHGALFTSATFSDDAIFNSAKFSDRAVFNLATFSKNADFFNAEFIANTDFSGVVFKTCVPDLRGATLHEATEWHGVIWPEVPRDKVTAQAQVYAYQRLKQEMERLKKHEDEQSFFRKELRARRGLDAATSGAWLLNYVYEASSDYGQSIGRPVFWLVVLFLVGFFVFANALVSNGAPMNAEVELRAITFAARLSFANIFSFLPIRREINTTDLSFVAQIFGALQTLFGVVLLFLLGLALRSRFRMR